MNFCSSIREWVGHTSIDLLRWNYGPGDANNTVRFTSRISDQAHLRYRVASRDVYTHDDQAQPGGRDHYDTGTHEPGIAIDARRVLSFKDGRLVRDE